MAPPSIRMPWDPPTPARRALRGYAFDPSLATQLETALFSEITYRVRWEQDLKAGPSGEYVEVIDVDPPSGCYYAPVDLNDPRILADQGLPPSEGNPQFHQQMVYAVAMTTIDRFERALGRRAFWADRYEKDKKLKDDERYVGQLRIYPHAVRAANAYYSRNRRALLFGYFPASPDRTSGQFPGGMVFTCLSHDIVAHETTHALLDGFHEYFMEPTNPDVLAFHEAFADIVALFQHFTFPEVLAHQIGKTRGDLRNSENLLGQLATQFGHSRGGHGALRDAIGHFDEEQGKWVPHKPDPTALLRTKQVHARGAILVAAVFDAFLSIYHNRTRDLVRLASGGTGVLPDGDIHPDLVNRLADEAARSASHVLNMCIRALDYCPPVDLRFGEYLRALITADMDIMPSDDHRYRVAFIEAFRRRGIFPDGVRTMSEDSLRWPRPEDDPAKTPQEVRDAIAYFIRELRLKDKVGSLRHTQSRREIWQRTRQIRVELHTEIKQRVPKAEVLQRLTGIALAPGEAAPGVRTTSGAPVFSVQAFREARRQRDDGSALNQVFITLTQKVTKEHHGQPHDVRCGTTFVLNLDEMNVNYVIGFGSGKEFDGRMNEIIEFQTARLDSAGLRSTYLTSRDEPFAALHSTGV